MDCQSKDGKREVVDSSLEQQKFGTSSSEDRSDLGAALVEIQLRRDSITRLADELV